MEIPNLSTGPLWGTYEKGKETSKITKTGAQPSSNLDKDAFLKLLMMQMKYQDPLNPMDDKEFVAQMAQFTALEQMTNLNTTTTNSQAFSLVGKEVYGRMYNATNNTFTEVQGRVDFVKIVKGSAVLQIGEKELTMKEVVNVGEDEYQLSILNSINNTNLNSQQLSLIGKHVMAIKIDQEGNPYAFVEGKVDYVKMVDGQPVLMVGNHQILPSEVMNISNYPELLGQLVDGIAADGTVVTKGEITGINIMNKKAYLVIKGGPMLQVDFIDKTLEAIRARNSGATAKAGDAVGKVVGVTIKNETVYVTLQSIVAEGEPEGAKVLVKFSDLQLMS